MLWPFSVRYIHDHDSVDPSFVAVVDMSFVAVVDMSFVVVVDLSFVAVIFRAPGGNAVLQLAGRGTADGRRAGCSSEGGRWCPAGVSPSLM